MKTYTYQNTLICKKQLRQLLAWSFTNYDSMQACLLADELKYLGFKYASQAGISISIEDLQIPFVKNGMLDKANQEIYNSEKIFLKGKITDVERFQKIIDTWNLTSESLKNQIIYYFKNYDPLNSVYIMAFSGARGNLSQVRQLVGMRGLMSDPSGQIMNLPIKKNFREGLTITDYLMSGYGARKGIVDTALKTANSGYLTRRLIDVAQDILIREKDCATSHSFYFNDVINKANFDFTQIVGRVTNQPIYDPVTNKIIVKKNTQLTSEVLLQLKEKNITKFYLRSPFTCNLYRAICQKCYGWDLADENLVEIGEAIGILAGQSIGEPGTQLTMRTFHTGGIFTSGARQQILSPLDGIIQYYKLLKTVTLRTTRGEDVLVTKNSGSLILIPDNPQKSLIKIDVLQNTILFPKNNQYVLKDTVIGELINTNKQIRIELKPIVSNISGEIFIPRLKQGLNRLTSNKLLWLLEGQLYNSPKNSFLNFFPDYKLNPHSYIFRTKIINHYTSSIEKLNFTQTLSQRTIKLRNQRYYLESASIYRISNQIGIKNAVLIIEKFKYLISIEKVTHHHNLLLTRNQQFGELITPTYQTETGGTVFYDYQNLLNQKNGTINYYPKGKNLQKMSSIPLIRTLIWLGSEVYTVNCEPKLILVDHGDVISKGLELIPGLFSKTSGLVIIRQKNQMISTITIKSGSVYTGGKFQKANQQLYYPGEHICSNISAKGLCFCEEIIERKNNQLLVRPITIYEFSKFSKEPLSLSNKNHFDFSIRTKNNYIYKPNQTINGVQSIKLIGTTLIFKTLNLSTQMIKLGLENCTDQDGLYLKLDENLSLSNYIPPILKYKGIECCFLIQRNQFLNPYTILGYFEATTKNSLEIVKLKIKTKIIKQILLISNNECLNIQKDTLNNKRLYDFITETKKVKQSGQIIIENKKNFTVQKGRTYFFPNCKENETRSYNNLQYKLLSSPEIQDSFSTSRNISLTYQDTAKLHIQNTSNPFFFKQSKLSVKTEFSKFFVKKNGKFYSSLLPQYLKKFSVNSVKNKNNLKWFIRSSNKLNLEMDKPERTLLLQSVHLTQNKYVTSHEEKYQLILVKFIGQPFKKSTKAVGLYSITEDFFEEDVNNVFCENSEFIETGKTVGLLKLEKEITGDIVQGLPRIEEILEARKKNIFLKRIPTSKKKGLLMQVTNLDPNFEFKRLGTTIKENDKINPHKLLKVYFNYYGRQKLFSCERTYLLRSNRLLGNYEGTYKSFKKIQSFILNSVQAVYNSQGVTINNKHLEIIIKQMTTKVLITYDGDTPLLRREVIDLYHIKYINSIIQTEFKQIAYYVPLLIGISKAALNNPSFISAASFQETTRVLTKAALEGKLDWLRGLKENIIIGHLIPAGTGSITYRECFKTSNKTKVYMKNYLNQASKIPQKSRQPF